MALLPIIDSLEHTIYQKSDMSPFTNLENNEHLKMYTKLKKKKERKKETCEMPYLWSWRLYLWQGDLKEILPPPPKKKKTIRKGIQLSLWSNDKCFLLITDYLPIIRTAAIVAAKKLAVECWRRGGGVGA